MKHTQINHNSEGTETRDAVSVNCLTKIYCSRVYSFKAFLHPMKIKEIKALDSVSFSIRSGDILGIVGPNGAGKTTLLKILAGVLRQDHGEVSFWGERVRSAKEHRKKIGYVSSDERSFFWRLSGRDNLEFFGRLYGLTAKHVRNRSEVLIKTFNFERAASRLFGDYSAGMRKKVAVMRALLHEPPILLLDEITNSLDPESAERVKEIVQGYIRSDENRAAIWCTHRLEEIPHVCDQVVSLNSGRVVAKEPVKDASYSCKAGQFVLKTKTMNGQFASFCSAVKEKIQDVKCDKNLNEFIFTNINDEEFSKIVTLAVKDYGAYIMFAGYLETKKLGQ